MADNSRTDQWRWKNSSEHDHSRREELRHNDGNQDNVVILRKKNRDQRRRREKMKKRWSVRPDVNLALVSRGMQCKLITAVVFIFIGLFLAVAGLVILVILKNISHVIWSVGIALLVLGVVILIVGLLYMLCKCCFRTSTRYKQYKAQFKAGGKYQMSEVSEQSPEMKRSPVKYNMQYAHQESARSLQSNTGDQPSDTTSRTYVTANEHTPSMRNSSTRPLSTPQWITSDGYRPMAVNDLSDYTVDMQTADEHHFDHNGHDQAATSPEISREDTLKDDFAKLEEALREMIVNKSRDGEMAHMMRGPLDTSTPVNPNAQTHHRVHRVPINIAGDQGVHRVPINAASDQRVYRVPLNVGEDHGVRVPSNIPGDHSVHRVPIDVESDHGVHTIPITVEGEYGVHRVPRDVEDQGVQMVPIMIVGHGQGGHGVHMDVGHQGVHTVPIMVEGNHGTHMFPMQEGDHEMNRVPILIEGDPRATPPNPIPPSYDQVLRNYRTYSRSASPTRLMESDL